MYIANKIDTGIYNHIFLWNLLESDFRYRIKLNKYN